MAPTPICLWAIDSMSNSQEQTPLSRPVVCALSQTAGDGSFQDNVRPSSDISKDRCVWARSHRRVVPTSIGSACIGAGCWNNGLGGLKAGSGFCLAPHAVHRAQNHKPTYRPERWCRTSGIFLVPPLALRYLNLRTDQRRSGSDGLVPSPNPAWNRR